MRTIKDLKYCLEEYEYIVQENTPNRLTDTIIVVSGHYTLSQKCEVCNADFPTQFTKTKAKELVKQFSKKNPYIDIIEINYLDWYKKRINQISNYLNVIDK